MLLFSHFEVLNKCFFQLKWSQRSITYSTTAEEHALLQLSHIPSYVKLGHVLIYQVTKVEHEKQGGFLRQTIPGFESISVKLSREIRGEGT